MRIQIQQLKKEVSRLQGLVDGGIVNKEIDNGAVCFPGSPGSFKWEGLQGSFSPLASDKRQRKEYEAALVGAFRRERDKELALQALAAENQATMHLAKKREDEIQGLKMRLRFREAGIKRLEAVASGKISAEAHLLQEKEEYLKEIEALRNQFDRNQEVTRLKSFYEEGERERMSEQVTILENKLLEALDWKLMHESDPENARNESSDLAALEDSLISSSKEPRSWRSSIKEENEFLRMQAIQNQSEMETLRRKLKSYESEIGEKEKLESRIKGLVAELEEEKTSAKNIQEAMQQLQVNLPCTTSREDNSSDVNSNAHELKTMVDAIASASQREAEAHEIAINLGKENDELRAKIKASIEDNQKLIELYQVAAAEVCKAREIHSNSGLAEQLQDMHEENEKLMGLYEKAMQERDEYKRRIFSCEQNSSEVKEEFSCPEKLVEVDGGKDFKFKDLSSEADDPKLLAETGVTGLIELSESDRRTEDLFIDEKHQIEAQAEVVGSDECSINESRPCKFTGVEILEELAIARNKLENVPDKLANVAKAFKSFGSLEKLFNMVDRLARDIKELEEGILAKKREIADIKHFSSQKQNQKSIVQNKLSALKSSTSKISSSFFYWEQREARARVRVDSSHTYVNKKEEALAHLQTEKEETEAAILNAQESELSLRDHLICLTSKLEKESLRKESENVLVTIDNLDKTNIPALRTWHCDVKATELLKAEEEKTKLKSELKQSKEKLSFVLKEIEDLKKRSKVLDAEIQVIEGDIVTGLQSAMEMELAYKNVIREKDTLQEMSENGRNDIQEMIVEYHQCVFECDLNDSEMKLLEGELQLQCQNLEDLRGSMVAATQNRAQLLDDAKYIFMRTEESSQSCYVSEKVEELLQEVVEELTDPQRSLCSKNTKIALDLKQKGNNCFTSGNYEKALSFYTQALRFAPMNDAYEDEKNLVSILYVNRASTLHKMGFMMECVRDCDRAIAIAPSYAKAWYRRGKANASLESYKDAVDDLNVAMHKELSLCRKSQIQDEVDIIVNEAGKKTSPVVKYNEKNSGSLDEPHLMELQCVSTPAKGRGMSSKTDIAQAFLILSEEPYAAVLLYVTMANISIRIEEEVHDVASMEETSKLPHRILNISSISLASNRENALADSNGEIPEHRHECEGVNWPRVLPSEIILAGRVLVKSMEQRKHHSETTKPIEALELTHNYVCMSVDLKLELHIYSIVLTYCLHHSSTVEFPLVGDSAAQLVIIICQIRVNSMAVVHMKSQESNWSLEHPGKVLPHEVSLTSNIEQVGTTRIELIASFLL
ncbi:Kinesin-like protein kin-12e [Thalictrum thalictroides]|uniref:Kinesin-like protein kin-12e n=1 Tax=Thalictrum thalictroides TaxID=46969 RepID=A0A7J6VU55_THATH|nr:Kinesin-like protein kin-12e [Thalictrum thalictroides]